MTKKMRICDIIEVDTNPWNSIKPEKGEIWRITCLSCKGDSFGIRFSKGGTPTEEVLSDNTDMSTEIYVDDKIDVIFANNSRDLRIGFYSAQKIVKEGRDA